VGGIPEVDEDGVNGFLVALGEAGRARVEENFTARPVREFETLFLRLANS